MNRISNTYRNIGYRFHKEYKQPNFLRLSVFIASLFFSIVANSQVSYGGRPLVSGIEKMSEIRTVADFVIELPKFNIDSIREISDLPGNRIGGLDFAHTIFTDFSPENSGLNFTAPDGTKVWKISIRSIGAYSLNILFSEFLLPEGAEVFIYNTDRTVILGSFNCKNRPKGGEFSISPVEGEELTVEYHEPSYANFSGKIRISEVNHDFRGLFRSGTRFNQLDLPCLPDVTCNTELDSIAQSVCLLIVNGTTYCTGVFVNNTLKDGRPYILTASHCLKSNPSLGSRVVVFMNYQSPGCDRRLRGSEEFSLSGSVTRAFSQEIDFALIELNELPPADYRPFLAGWNLNKDTYNDSPYTNIHHPFGEVKKYSIENDSIVKANWFGNGNDGILSGNHWNVFNWEKGHTWSGSSGSPVFDKNFLLRGCLTGGDSGGETGCKNGIRGDFFFRFDRAWNQYPDSSKQLMYWLDPLSVKGSSGIKSLKGLNPYSENSVRRISNISPEDSLVKAYYAPPYHGAVFGHNSFGISEYAEHFSIQDSGMLKGVYLMIAKGTNNETSNVKINIYKGGTKPGRKLVTAVLNMNYLDYSVSGYNFHTIAKTTYTNKENYFRLEKPVSVGKDFYIGYEIDYPVTESADSFFVYGTFHKKTYINTAWYKNQQFWFPFSSSIIKPAYTSLWIEPLIMRDTLLFSDTIHTEDPDTFKFASPRLVYSELETSLYIWLPNEWKGNTKVEFIDLTGRIIKTEIIIAPLTVIRFDKPGKSLFFVRLTGHSQTFTTKFLKY